MKAADFYSSSFPQTRESRFLVSSLPPRLCVSARIKMGSRGAAEFAEKKSGIPAFAGMTM